MKEKKLSEQDAFVQCEKEFTAEFEDLQRALQRATIDPYKGMAERIIRTVGRHDIEARQMLLRKRTPPQGRLAKHKSPTVEDMLQAVIPKKEVQGSLKQTRWNNRFFAERDHFLARKPVSGLPTR